MEDRCPHRFIPLSFGALENDVLRCAYHGLAFDKSGSCVHSPYTNEPVPHAKVATHAAVERHTCIWFWAGDPSLADPSTIPDFSFLEHDRPVHHGIMTMEVDHELIIDNLMDLTHAEFIHRESFGIDGALLNGGTQTVRQEPNGDLWNCWQTANTNPPRWARPNLEEGQKVDQWINVRWSSPANLALFVGMAKSGTDCKDLIFPANGDPHILTPASENATHYFYAHGLEQEEFDRLDQVFGNEDHPILLAQQKAMKGRDFWDLHPAILPSDAGAIRVRRRRAQILRAEQAKQATAIAAE